MASFRNQPQNDVDMGEDSNEIETWKFFEKSSHDVQPWKFDGQKWIQTNLSPPSISISNYSMPSTLSIVTYNVWFDNWECLARWQAIFQIIEKLRPTIIGFQECTLNFMNLLTQNEFIRKNYILSDTSDQLWEGGRYGVCLLIQKEIGALSSKIQVHKLPSGMCRNAILSKLTFPNGNTICVGTVHLESLSNKLKRRDQLALLSEIYGSVKAQSSFLFGDFNFDSSKNWDREQVPLENENIKKFYPTWDDMWNEVNPKDAGITFDSNANGVIGKYERMRYDRIIANLAPQWVPMEMKMIGTEPFKPRVWPSDHFGLYLLLQNVS